MIPAFEIRRFGQSFVSASPIRIDLEAVDPGLYRVVAVHNFQVEDRDPDLGRCVAGVFLARRRGDGSWEEPERFPMECRAVQVLGELQVPGVDPAP